MPKSDSHTCPSDPSSIFSGLTSRCGCCSLICSTSIGAPLLPVPCPCYEYSGDKAKEQAGPSRHAGSVGPCHPSYICPCNLPAYYSIGAAQQLCIRCPGSPGPCASL